MIFYAYSNESVVYFKNVSISNFFYQANKDGLFEDLEQVEGSEIETSYCTDQFNLYKDELDETLMKASNKVSRKLFLFLFAQKVLLAFD